MRRLTSRGALLALLMVSLLWVATLAPHVDAQDSTPAAGPPAFELAPGVTAEALAFAEGQEAPALYRLIFEPGVTYAFDAVPEISLALVESGPLALTVDVPVSITRAGATDESGEDIEADTEFTVETGDYFVLAPFASGEVRNDVEEAASVMVAAIIVDAASAAEATPTS